MSTPNAAEGAVTVEACWQKIGVWGDLSCPELRQFGHCHNCPRYTESGRRLLDTPVQDEYLKEWARRLAAPAAEKSVEDGVLYLSFRIGRSWLALPSTCLREVLHPAPIRRVPHRRVKVLLGLTTVRGDILICVSLHELLHESVTEAPPPTRRFVVAADGADTWVFPVDEVLGLTMVVESAIRPPPATLTESGGAYVRGQVDDASRMVGILDHELVFRGLQRGLA